MFLHWFIIEKSLKSLKEINYDHLNIITLTLSMFEVFFKHSKLVLIFKPKVQI